MRGRRPGSSTRRSPPPIRPTSRDRCAAMRLGRGCSAPCRAGLAFEVALISRPSRAVVDAPAAAVGATGRDFAIRCGGFSTLMSNWSMRTKLGEANVSSSVAGGLQKRAVSQRPDTELFLKGLGVAKRYCRRDSIGDSFLHRRPRAGHPGAPPGRDAPPPQPRPGWKAQLR